MRRDLRGPRLAAEYKLFHEPILRSVSGELLECFAKLLARNPSAKRHVMYSISSAPNYHRFNEEGLRFLPRESDHAGNRK